MRPHSLGPTTTRVSTLAMESGNVFNLQDFEQNEVPFKQRSFEDSTDTFFSLFDADLLLIWMNKFRHGFRFRSATCPVLHIVLIISRGECTRLAFYSDFFPRIYWFVVLLISLVNYCVKPPFRQSTNVVLDFSV